MRYLLIAIFLLVACGAREKPEPAVQKSGVPYMMISVKDFGEIAIELYPGDAPKNVQNMIDLAEKGYFNGLIFHRVIDGFVIQGGCPKGDGTGDPGYEIEDEISTDLKHLKGTVAMANRGPNTNGSQFYICLEPQPRLDGRYTIIGKVVQGMDVVERIGKVKTGANNRPVDAVVMEKVRIEK
jgi:cyclophilin family peptidyl-prolyl cis-trans isomerase